MAAPPDGKILKQGSQSGEMRQEGNTSSPGRKRLGEILVEKGIITSHTVDRMLPLCAKAGKRFGAILEEVGLVTGEELAQALAVQWGCRVIADFAKYKFSPEILQLIPVETAVEHMVFPLKVQQGVLALAVIDPTNDKVIHNLKQNIKMPVRQFIATRKDINDAIARHYLDKTVGESSPRNTILIVEDDKLIVNILTNILTQEGYDIVTASDGMEAFKQIISRKPNLVLTDKEMPKFDGYALLNSLQHIPEMNTIPVILISSSTNPDEEADAYEKGFFDYLSKPVRQATLKAKVKRALRSHRHLLSFYS